MSKYEPLSDILKACPNLAWRASFDEIERVLNFRLPASARKYPAWWSNDPQSHSQTRAWLSVGWKTAQVDITGEKVTFLRNADGKVKTLHQKIKTTLPPTILNAVPQWIQHELLERAEAQKQSVETVLVHALERGLARDKHTNMMHARKLRALVSEPATLDLDALIRQGRTGH